jgi:hypothetical protein
MPHDLALVAETRAWLEKASEDLAAAALDLGANPPLCGDTAFHAQQAVEKALKAFLTWHGREFRKMHNGQDAQWSWTPPTCRISLCGVKGIDYAYRAAGTLGVERR